MQHEHNTKILYTLFLYNKKLFKKIIQMYQTTFCCVLIILIRFLIKFYLDLILNVLLHY